MPGFDRGVIDDELIFLLVFGLNADLDCTFDEGEGVAHLFQVSFAFVVQFRDFSLLNGGICEQSLAVELVLLRNALEENVENTLGALIAFLRQKTGLTV